MPISYADVVTLDEAKDHLNLTDSDADPKLASIISAASQMWQRRVGPIAANVDEWYNGGTPQIVLYQTPVVSITSVVESWGPIVYTLEQVVLDSGSWGGVWTYSLDDADRGIITRRMSGLPACFAGGLRNVHVTYVAGYNGAVPDDLKRGVLLLVEHIWESQRTRSPIAGPANDFAAAASTYSWPRKVDEIAAAFTVPGIA